MKKNNSSDLSAIIEAQTHRTDDRTGALKSEDLRKAHREAQKVLRKANGSFLRSLLKFLGFVIFLAIIGGASYTAMQSKLELPSLNFSKMISNIFRKIPKIDDISEIDNDVFNSIPEANLDKDGLRIKIAHSQINFQNPSFYVAANLPHGTALNLHLFGKPGQVLSKRPVQVQTPLTIVKYLGKTPPLHLKDGSALPPGRYQAYLFEDDEQSKDVKEVLSKFPLNATELSIQFHFIPPNRKIAYSEEVFIGNKSDPQLTAKMKALHNEIRKEGQAELSLLKGGLEFFDHAIQLTSNIEKEYISNKRPQSFRKKWQAFLQTWNANHPVLNEQGYYYSKEFNSLRAIQKELIETHGLQVQEYSQFKQIKASVGPVAQRLLGFREWIKNLDKLYLNPDFFPARESVP